MKRLQLPFLIFFAICQGSCHVEQTSKSPHVARVFPSSDTLPSNLMRMYIQFSEPMKTVGNLEKIRLVNQNGQEVTGAIFNNVYELWDEDQKQLTLIFDPARVKTGLQANEDLGRALKVNQSYELILENLETINHIKIEPAVKHFYVVPADTVQPNIEKWNIQVPKPATLEPLTVSIPEMADWMSLLHKVRITNEREENIDGTVEIRNAEKEWVFVPIKKWQQGKYSIFASARFADPAGNNLNGLFDHDVGSLRFESEDQIIKRTFEIK